MSADPARPPPEKKEAGDAGASAASVKYLRPDDSSAVSPLPPHSIEAEQSVLGAMLIDNNALGKIADVVAEGDFYLDGHRRIFRHIARLLASEIAADVVTVAEAIKASEDAGKTGGIEYLAALFSYTPSAHNARRYAEMVRDFARAREIQAAALELHGGVARGDIEDALGKFGARVAAIGGGRTAWGHALDLEALAEREPARPDFLVADWLPSGYVTLFAGHGGVGKSLIALFVAVCLAAGMPFFGVEVARRRVLFLSCEDRERVLHWRLARICSYLGVDLASLRGWLEIVDLVGADSILWERDPRTGSTITPAYETLRRRVKASGAEVLVVDGASDAYAGNENNRGDVKRYNNALLALIPPDRGAVLQVAHVDKVAARDGSTSEGYSGSTAWHNAARARWYLRPETAQGEGDERPTRTGALLLDLQKSNFGRADQSMRFRWDDDAHLFLGERLGASAFDRKHQEREERAAILRGLVELERLGRLVPTSPRANENAAILLAERPGFPASLGGKAGTTRLFRELRLLEEQGLVRRAPVKNASRHLIETWQLSAAGKAAANG